MRKRVAEVITLNVSSLGEAVLARTPVCACLPFFRTALDKRVINFEHEVHSALRMGGDPADGDCVWNPPRCDWFQLVFGNEVLQCPARILVSYGLHTGSTVLLIRSPLLTVFAKRPSPSAKTLRLQVMPSDTIEHVKTMIADQMDIQADQQHLTYGGITMKNGRTMSDYSIPEGARFTVYRRLLTELGDALVV